MHILWIQAVAARLQDGKNMTHDEAIEKSKEFLYLVGERFLNSNDEKETIKAVVAWEEDEGDWYPHACFYNWASSHQGQMSHMRVDDFLKRYQLIDARRP